jgi:tetratricopeptide (TPR) repeat protein
MKKTVSSLAILLLFHSVWSQDHDATIKEYKKEFKTYGFSDPDPIARMGPIYPYYRFDGYTDRPLSKDWKVVELENDFIRVMVLPEIGGKIWGAWEKSTGKPFIYYNHVVKFRDVAMRGPWTSGGIEANYGIIGHTPNCATPVDYKTEKKDDGSVSCYIGTLDLLTETYWTIEINLSKDKAYFTTHSFWHNSTPLEQSYYTWMNAGIKASGNLQFIYPGNRYIGHSGEYADWHINRENQKDISFYDENNFGGYKSYHVFGKYTDFFGAYWHDDHLGMVHYSNHDEKAGKKIWIWGLSNQGMIWKKLLTDTDGQYVEVQSGRLFNQAAIESTLTPFKHLGFAPASTDSWTEYWFPVKNTDGFIKANSYGALNVRKEGTYLKLTFSPVQDFREELKIVDGNRQVYSKALDLKILNVFSDSIAFDGNVDSLVVTLGNKLQYRFDSRDGILNRPVDSPVDFNWNSVYGLYLQGKEAIRQRYYKLAEDRLKNCLMADPNYLPALVELSMLMYRNMEYQQSLDYALHALRIDTYDPACNFYYGLANAQLGRIADAKDGFDIATLSTEFRGAAYIELSKIYFRENDFVKSAHYAARSLEVNGANPDAHQLLALIYRLTNEKEKAQFSLDALNTFSPLNHFIQFEQYRWDNSEASRDQFTSGIRNELPQETYLRLADWYFSLGLAKESLEVLRLAPPGPEVYYWLAFLKNELKEGDAEAYIEKANALSAKLVFPFRSRTAEILNWVIGRSNSWKPKYYLGLIYWNRNNETRAKELFMQCGSPDFSYFYGARALLMHGEGFANDLRRAEQLDPNEWRYGKLLVDHFVKNNNYPEALRIAKRYSDRFPGDFRIDLLLANTMLLNKQYKACAEILKKTEILPYEGATDGRRLYREAWLMQATEQLQLGKYKAALASVHNARLWPENLGAGKPYDEDIDDRLESYIEGICFENTRSLDRAIGKWNEIISFETTSNNANSLIAALALKKANRMDGGGKLLAEWLREEPESKLAQWCFDFYHGNHRQAPDDLKWDQNFRIVKALLATP